MPDKTNKKKKDKNDKKKRRDEALNSILAIPPDNCDPEGSYTGRPRNSAERPTQDVDDL